MPLEIHKHHLTLLNKNGTVAEVPSVLVHDEKALKEELQAEIAANRQIIADETSRAQGVESALSNDVAKCVKKSDISSDILNLVYPVGTIYASIVATNPNTLFGLGTWERIGEGKCLIDAGSTYTAGTNYGSATKEYTPDGSVGNHTVTINEMPSHNHSLNNHSFNKIGTVQAGSGNSALNDWGTAPTIGSTGGGKAHSHGFTGTKASINVMQPSLAVYIWKRTA